MSISFKYHHPNTMMFNMVCDGNDLSSVLSYDNCLEIYTIQSDYDLQLYFVGCFIGESIYCIILWNWNVNKNLTLLSIDC